jgi:hypothetical protein
MTREETVPLLIIYFLANTFPSSAITQRNTLVGNTAYQSAIDIPNCILARDCVSFQKTTCSLLRPGVLKVLFTDFVAVTRNVNFTFYHAL